MAAPRWTCAARSTDTWTVPAMQTSKRSCGAHLPAVDLTPVGDSGDDHQALIVVDCVHDSVVADSHPVVVAPGELDGSGWTWIEGQGVDGSRDALAERAVETSVRPRCLRVKADFIRLVAGYARTSLQGKAASRSSRACRAARLSSRYSRRSMSSA